MSGMVLAATSPGEQVFYVLTPEDASVDGVVMRDGEVMYVPFWSYVTRNPDLVPVRGVELLDKLWSKDGGDEWVGKFLTHDVPLTEDEVLSVEFLSTTIPEDRSVAAGPAEGLL